MKKFYFLLAFILLLSVIVNAQDYRKIICPVCRGNGAVWSGYYDYYGNPIPTPCYNCGGARYVWVPCNNSTSFRGNNYVYKQDVVLYRYGSHGKYYKFGVHGLYYYSGSYYIKSPKGERYYHVSEVSPTSMHYKYYKYFCLLTIYNTTYYFNIL